MPPLWRSRWVQPRTRRVARYLQLRQFDLQLAFVACARAARRCPGSARCGRPRDARCASRGCAAGPGVSVWSNITSRRRSAIGRSLDLVGLAACRRTARRRAPRARGHGADHGSAPAERASSANSSSRSGRASRAGVQLDQDGAFARCGRVQTWRTAGRVEHASLQRRHRRRRRRRRGCTSPPPGPTRTLRAGTTVEIACL